MYLNVYYDEVINEFVPKQTREKTKKVVEQKGTQIEGKKRLNCWKRYKNRAPSGKS